MKRVYGRLFPASRHTRNVGCIRFRLVFPLPSAPSSHTRLVRSLQRYQFDPSHLAQVWVYVEVLLGEGHSEPAAPLAAYRVMNIMNEWQRDALGPLRVEFLTVLRTHNAPYEVKQTALGYLVADGEAIDPFAADVVGLLRSWLKTTGAC